MQLSVGCLYIYWVTSEKNRFFNADRDKIKCGKCRLYWNISEVLFTKKIIEICYYTGGRLLENNKDNTELKLLSTVYQKIRKILVSSICTGFLTGEKYCKEWNFWTYLQRGRKDQPLLESCLERILFLSLNNLNQLLGSL